MKRIPLKKSVLYQEIQQRNKLLLGTGLLTGVLLSVFLYYRTRQGWDVKDLCSWGAACGLLFSAFQLYLFFRRSLNPFTHPCLKPLLKYGNYEVLLGMMDDDLKSEKEQMMPSLGTLYPKKWPFGILCTKNFLFKSSLFRFDWIPYSQICWVYIIPQIGLAFRPNYARMHLFLDSGREVKIKTDFRGRTYNYLQQIAPFAFYGYSVRLESIWAKNPRDIINDVKRRIAIFHKNPPHLS